MTLQQIETNRCIHVKWKWIRDSCHNLFPSLQIRQNASKSLPDVGWIQFLYKISLSFLFNINICWQLPYGYKYLCTSDSIAIRIVRLERNRQTEREREEKYNFVKWCEDEYFYESNPFGMLGFISCLQFKLNRVMCHYKSVFMVNRTTKINW
jgi:hypothetical protein